MADLKKKRDDFHYPKQYDENIGHPVEVSIGCNTKNTVLGTLIRDDAEEPFRTIIRLDDGRIIITNEFDCCYRILPKHGTKDT